MHSGCKVIVEGPSSYNATTSQTISKNKTESPEVHYRDSDYSLLLKQERWARSGCDQATLRSMTFLLARNLIEAALNELSTI